MGGLGRTWKDHDGGIWPELLLAVQDKYRWGAGAASAAAEGIWRVRDMETETEADIRLLLVAPWSGRAGDALADSLLGRRKKLPAFMGWRGFGVRS